MNANQGNEKGMYLNTLDGVFGALRRAKGGGFTVAALSVLLLVAPGAMAQTGGAEPARADEVSNEVLAEKINSLWDAIVSVRREIDSLRAEMTTEFASLRTNHHILMGAAGFIATLLTLLLGFMTFSHINTQRQMARLQAQITEQNRRMDEQIAEQNRQNAEQNRRMDERMARMEEQNTTTQDQIAVMQDQIAVMQGQITRLLPPDEPAARAVG